MIVNIKDNIVYIPTKLHDRSMEQELLNNLQTQIPKVLILCFCAKNYFYHISKAHTYHVVLVNNKI